MTRLNWLFWLILEGELGLIGPSLVGSIHLKLVSTYLQFGFSCLNHFALVLDRSEVASFWLSGNFG